MLDLLQLGSPGLTDLISDELNAQLRAAGKLMHYRDGQLIHSRGDKNPGLSVVTSGAVRLGNVGSDGSFLTSAIFGPGQCFGDFTMLAGLPRTHDATAIGDCAINQIPGPKFMTIFNREPDLARALLFISLRRTQGLSDFLDDLRRLPLPVHVAKFLLSMQETARKPDEIHCRQEDLAFTFGLSRVSIGKVLKQLERDGLIALGYGKIIIPDVKVLKEWVQERSLVTPLAARDWATIYSPPS